MTNQEFSRYESYTACEIPWLDFLPTHWECKDLKYVSTINPCGYRATNHEIVTFLPMEAVTTKGETDNSRVGERGLYPASLTEFRRCDVILAKITPCFENGKAAYLHQLTTEKGIGSTEFHVIRADTKIMEPRFTYYLVSNCEFRRYAECFMEGSAGQKRVTTPFLTNMKFPIPCLPTQQRIANYLDQKTAEIDEAIAKKQRLIELLKEQKAILINQAVTKGLNPDAPMRESGVEWIGEVPGHWEVRPNRYVFREINERSEKGEEIHLSMSQKLGLVPAKDLNVLTLQSESYEGAKLCLEGDLVLNRLKAHLAVFSTAPCDGVVSPDYSVFRLQEKRFKSEYFENLFKTPMYLSEFNRRVRGIVVGFYRLYSSDFNAISCIVPPDHEQTQIMQRVCEISSHVSSSQAHIVKEIEAILEFKAILISSAVTGKIKI